MHQLIRIFAFVEKSKLQLLQIKSIIGKTMLSVNVYTRHRKERILDEEKLGKYYYSGVYEKMAILH